MRLDFALTGMPGAGKTESGNYLERRHGFKQFSGSGFLQQRARELGITLSMREDFAIFYTDQRRKLGASFIAEQSLKMPGERVANVGMRTRCDVERFIKAGGVLIGLECDQLTRFERTAGTDPKYPVNFESFVAADELDNTNGEEGIHVVHALSVATHTVDNNGSVVRLYQQLDDIVELYSSSQQG